MVKHKSDQSRDMVRLGAKIPGDGKTLTPMLTELSSSRKDHNDVALICDDGKILAHKFFLAAHSKFLK